VAIRTASIRVIFFVLLVASAALCMEPPPVDGLQGLQSAMLAAGSLPDAPSTVQPPRHEQRFRARSTAGQMPRAISIGVMHEAELGRFRPVAPRSLTTLYQVSFLQNGPSTFLDKYLYPTPLKQDTGYYPSTSESFVGRASYAASRIFVTRDDSGKAKLNTRYFLGALSAVAMHAAYRPYGARSTSETLNNFGSTVGGDAGISVFHEFRPGILQMVKGLTPRFLSRIEEHITHNQIPR
jgi:hypothetical protein